MALRRCRGSSFPAGWASRWNDAKHHRSPTRPPASTPCLRAARPHRKLRGARPFRPQRPQGLQSVGGVKGESPRGDRIGAARLGPRSSKAGLILQFAHGPSRARAIRGAPAPPCQSSHLYQKVVLLAALQQDKLPWSPRRDLLRRHERNGRCESARVRENPPSHPCTLEPSQHISVPPNGKEVRIFLTGSVVGTAAAAGI